MQTDIKTKAADAPYTLPMQVVENPSSSCHYVKQGQIAVSQNGGILRTGGLDPCVAFSIVQKTESKDKKTETRVLLAHIGAARDPKALAEVIKGNFDLNAEMKIVLVACRDAHKNFDPSTLTETGATGKRTTDPEFQIANTALALAGVSAESRSRVKYKWIDRSSVGGLVRTVMNDFDMLTVGSPFSAVRVEVKNQQKRLQGGLKGVTKGMRRYGAKIHKALMP